jgi:hypothetical protein
MANCSIPNSNPASGRISTTSLKPLRKQNSQPRACVSVIRRTVFSVQKRRQVREGELVTWPRQVGTVQSVPRAQRIQSTVGSRADGIGETEGKAAMGSGEPTSFNRRSAIWRVKGAWWPSRSSKPSSPYKWRGGFDSYPLRLFFSRHPERSEAKSKDPAAVPTVNSPGLKAWPRGLRPLRCSLDFAE